ncbi:ferrochelatase [Dermatobacter hominis]|uniref:ferrochelatase n=1 Tax=Dermatobacter hominis TaxID=2884263 RepID=UPI001D100169|nr:ferrochelatase [Dermatobacter hominis]UDY34617.1 ferrochelatase [Dermatobacter hominis]
MTTGVLVMAYGTPAGPDDVEAYYTHIRRGRPPTPEQLADLVRRYDALGGTSPMAERTRAQVRAIDEALQRIPDGGFVTELGQKHAAPFVEDGVAALAGAGVERIVGLVLAPHFSAGSVAQYHERAAATAAERGLPFIGIDSWHLLPELIDFQAAAVRESLATFPERTKVVFTAHSLPERVLEGDPYPDQLRRSAEATARAAGLATWAGWGLGWQSAGRTPEPWRGPDVLEIVRDLAGTGRADGLLVVPQGFTSDHLEVLYDLDVEAAAVAAEVGLAFGRTPVVNDDPAVMGALARTAADAAAGLRDRA